MFQLQWFNVKHHITETCVISYCSGIPLYRILETLKKLKKNSDEMYGRLQKYTGLQTNSKKKKNVILILCVLVKATRIHLDNKSPEWMPVIFFLLPAVYREGGFVLCFTDGKRKRTEGSARHFTETCLTGDQIIEHFSLKNNVQMQSKHTPCDSRNILSSVLTFILIIENASRISSNDNNNRKIYASCLRC